MAGQSHLTGLYSLISQVTEGSCLAVLLELRWVGSQDDQEDWVGKEALGAGIFLQGPAELDSSPNWAQHLRGPQAPPIEQTQVQ